MKSFEIGVVCTPYTYSLRWNTLLFVLVSEHLEFIPFVMGKSVQNFFKFNQVLICN